MRSTRPSARAGAAILAVALLGTSTAARAGEEDAKAFFAAGRQLRAAGKCGDAIPKFRLALDNFPEGLGALRNIAECEEALSRFAAARRSWRDLRVAALQSNETKYAGWDKDADARYAALADKVGRLTIKLDGRDLGRVQLLMDGRPLDPRNIGVELERDPGDHEVQAFYGGATAVVEKFSLREGQTLEVVLKIPDPAREAPKPKPLPPPPSGPSGALVGSLVGFGVGALGVAGTIVSIVIRENALSEIESGCPGYDEPGRVCPSTLMDARDRGDTASLLVNVFGGVAIVGLATGAVLLGVDQATTPSAPAVAVSPIGGGAAASARWRF